MSGSMYGKDRRRRLSPAEAATLFSIAGGRCQRCDAPLGVEWHQAHLVAYSHGGATNVTQMQAWCRDCNLRQGSVDAAEVGLPALRTWQAQAMDVVLERNRSIDLVRYRDFAGELLALESPGVR